MILGMLSIPPTHSANAGNPPLRSARKAAVAVVPRQNVPGKNHHSGGLDHDRKRQRHGISLVALVRDVKDVLLMAVGKDDSEDYECTRG